MKRLEILVVINKLSIVDGYVLPWILFEQSRMKIPKGFCLSFDLVSIELTQVVPQGGLQ